jgi:hypothetical protein
MKSLAAAVLASFALLGPSPVAAQDVEAVKKQLLGTWKVVSVIREEVPSGVKTDLMGKDPVGYITYGPDNRMMVILVRGDRSKPASNIATAGEAEALFRSVTSYAGSYTVDGDKLTHHVDVSWNESWTGTKQTRFYKFDGDKVILSTPLSPDPVDGKMSVRSLVWQKVK